MTEKRAAEVAADIGLRLLKEGEPWPGIVADLLSLVWKAKEEAVAESRLTALDVDPR